MEVRCIWKGPNALGEGPLWNPHKNLLYWIDLVRQTLHRLDPETQDYQEWQMPDYIGTIALHRENNLIATLGNKVVSLELPTLHIKTLAVIQPWRSDVYMNEGKCDRQGRFWFGVASLDVENPQGGLFCLAPDGSVKQMETGITISNGLAWSPDNKKFYYTDGLKYCIYQYDFDLARGLLSNKKIFIQLIKSPIEPDGLTVDSQGNIWEAQWNSGKIFCYASNGTEQMIIDMPVQRPTSCTFGGRDLKTLYVTSCSQGKGEKNKLPAPAGALFAIKMNVSGIPESTFGEKVIMNG